VAGFDRLVRPVRSNVPHRPEQPGETRRGDDRTPEAPLCCCAGPASKARPRGGMVSRSSPLQRSPLVELPSGSNARAEASARRFGTTDTRMLACYRVSVNDTSSDVARVQALVHRRMGGPRKLMMACQMSDAVRAMASARIRSRHPELNEREIRDELIWELYGVRRGR
jgi:hypothetical protein